jgi:hypothetical protein
MKLSNLKNTFDPTEYLIVVDKDVTEVLAEGKRWQVFSSNSIMEVEVIAVEKITKDSELQCVLDTDASAYMIKLNK